MQKRQSNIGFIIRVATITSLGALSIDAMLPALPDIGQALRVTNPNNMQLVISLFIFGMFFGDLWMGPLSDSLGRKQSLVIGVAIYCLGSLLSMCAWNMEVMLAGRILQGVGASGPRIVSRAMVRDKFTGAHMARVFSFITALFVLIPMIAPIIGQVISQLFGWRAIFVVFLLMAIASTGWIMAAQPETLPPDKRTKIRTKSLLVTSRRIISHKRVLYYAITIGLVFGVFLLYLSTSQSMFEQIYSKTDDFPLYYAILASGFGLATLLNSKLVMKFGMQRLSAAALSGLFIISIFFFLTGEKGVPSFFHFMTGCYFMMFCIGLLFANLNALAMVPLGAVAGLGASLVSGISTLLSLAIAITAGRFFDANLHVLNVLIFGCSILGLYLIYLANNQSSQGVQAYSKPAD